jgi:rRNA-processing protein FCF1
MKIVLDTNFLIDCVRFKIDMAKELAGHEIYTVESVIPELMRIASKNTKDASSANIALKIASSLDILPAKEKETDDSMLSYSKDGYVIATQDSALKVRIKDAGGKVAYIRQRKYVSL